MKLPLLFIVPACLVTIGANDTFRRPSPVSVQGAIEIAADFESARATLDLFTKNTATDEELTRVAQLAGNQGLIRQAARFDPNATEQNFKQSLKQLIETGALKNDPFSFLVVKERLLKTRELLEQIQKNPRALMESVKERMAKYTPAGVSMNVKVYFVVGGTSDGFAPDASRFFVALHYLQDDFEGLRLLMAHELYHNAQGVARRAKQGNQGSGGSVSNVSRSLNLLQNTLNEGTASVVGDPLEIADGKAYISWFQTKYRNNLRRINVNFALFDTLLFRLYHDPDANANQLYNIGFSGMLDSPLYFVGYRMAKVIEKYKGKDALARAIGDPPIEFFNQYVEIYRKQTDPELIRFDKATEDILAKLR